MNGSYPQKAPVDARIVAYRFIKKILVVLICAVIVKSFILDTVKIRTTQMSPAIENGDRVLLLRFPYTAPVKWFSSPKRLSPVVYRKPFIKKEFGCLRLVARSGDSISIRDGRMILHSDSSTLAALPPNETVMSRLFSPRDHMQPFRIPQKGESVSLLDLSLRDFFFTASIIRQENPLKDYVLKPILAVDGKIVHDFMIADFPLYKGSLDSISDQHTYDWFFWDKLNQYLSATLTGQKKELNFALFQNGDRINNYRFKSSCVFLIADNWVNGYDSRYFGPVKESLIRGQAAAVLWSFYPAGETGGIRWSRIGKLIK